MTWTEPPELDAPSGEDAGAAEALLRLFHATVPTAEGVILATADGTPLVHDLHPAFDAADAVARADATRRRTPGSAEAVSTFVDTAFGNTLVVFVEPGFAMHAGLMPPMDAPGMQWATDGDGPGHADHAY